jgi:hypothetical protein
MLQRQQQAANPVFSTLTSEQDAAPNISAAVVCAIMIICNISSHIAKKCGRAPPSGRLSHHTAIAAAVQCSVTNACYPAECLPPHLYMCKPSAARSRRRATALRRHLHQHRYSVMCVTSPIQACTCASASGRACHSFSAPAADSSCDMRQLCLKASIAPALARRSAACRQQSRACTRVKAYTDYHQPCCTWQREVQVLLYCMLPYRCTPAAAGSFTL